MTVKMIIRLIAGIIRLMEQNCAFVAFIDFPLFKAFYLDQNFRDILDMHSPFYFPSKKIAYVFIGREKYSKTNLMNDLPQSADSTMSFFLGYPVFRLAAMLQNVFTVAKLSAIALIIGRY